MAQRGTLRLIMLGIRLFLIGILASAVIGAGIYVMKLRSDNAILKANQLKLESAVADQQELIASQKKADQIFRDINIEVNGFFFMNYLAYWSLRLGGFLAWNKHRKVNAKIK